MARFRHYFVEDEIQDLATPWFTQADAQDRADRAAERAEADSLQSGAR